MRAVGQLPVLQRQTDQTRAGRALQSRPRQRIAPRSDARILPRSDARIAPRSDAPQAPRSDQGNGAEGNGAGASPAPTRLALVGGGLLVRGATAKLLAAQDGLEVVGSFDSIAQFLASDLPRPPTILILDCDGASAESGCRTAASVIGRAYPQVKLALLCRDLSSEIARCAMEYRVAGVLLKSYTAEDVRHAIEYMASGRTIMPAGWQRVASSIQRDPQLLSPRLRQIHTLLAQGLSNERIAAELSLSPNTVKFHVRALYARLGVHNRVEASLLYAQMTRSGG